MSSRFFCCLCGHAAYLCFMQGWSPKQDVQNLIMDAWNAVPCLDEPGATACSQQYTSSTSCFSGYSGSTEDSLPWYAKDIYSWRKMDIATAVRAGNGPAMLAAKNSMVWCMVLNLC